MKKMLSLVLALSMLISMVAVSGASADAITDFKDYQTLANEMETFNILYAQSNKELSVLTNCIDGLLTNDVYGNLAPNAAYEWSSEDSVTWTFKLNQGITWVDVNGNYMADCVAEDWLWGLEWVLNSAKNQAANTSMPIAMIAGAGDYYEYTKTLSEDEAKALGLEKFLEMVGIAAPDDYTLVYTCNAPYSYFPTLCCYNCLYPLSGKQIEALGADGIFNQTNETMWYNGPYTITSYIQGNEKVFTKNASYWNKDVNLFNTVTVKMIDDLSVGYQLFSTGELDRIQLTQSNLSTIANNTSHEFYNFLTEYPQTKYAYSMHLIFDKKLEDGSEDINWNTAVANTAFRQSMLYGLDWSSYLARINNINPLKCTNYTYTAKNVSKMSDGRDYTEVVLDKLGLSYSNETYTRYDAEKAAALKAQAIEELTALGVTFPVSLDYYVQGSNQTAIDTAQVLKQMFSDTLGDDYIVVNVKTYVSSLAQEVRNPQLASMISTGWGADFGDVVNFMGQETLEDDNAYFSIAYSKINKVSTETTNAPEELLATYATFTEMVRAADAITDDQDKRNEAFAEAEAYFLNAALVLPSYVDIGWQLTCRNDYTLHTSAYGIQVNRYVDWGTNSDIYTTAEYDAIVADYNSAK